MKRRVYLAAALLGIFAAVLFGCAVIYVWGAYPVRRHPYAYPFSIVCGCIAAVLCIAMFVLWLYYIIGCPESKVRAILCSIPITAACFFAGFFLFSQSYNVIADVVHRLDP